MNKKDKKTISFPGYPHYPASEDIYNQEKRMPSADADDPFRLMNQVTDEEAEMPEEDNGPAMTPGEGDKA